MTDAGDRERTTESQAGAGAGRAWRAGAERTSPDSPGRLDAEDTGAGADEEAGAGAAARSAYRSAAARRVEAENADVDAEDTGETRNQKLQRNIAELLQELRVAQAGVQILFGFLLTVVFTDRFHHASGLEKALHLCAVLLAVAATALLTAPAAWHRVLFRAGRREEILHVGNRLVLVGLACLAAAVTVTVALIAEVVYGLVALVVVAVFTLLLFGMLWGLVPYRIRRDQASRG